MSAYATTPEATAAARRAAGQQKLRGLRRRTRRMRMAVLAVAVGLFLAIWLVLLVRLASGHDPVLSRSAHVTTTAHASTVAKPASPSTPAATPAAVSTHQS